MHAHRPPGFKSPTRSLLAVAGVLAVAAATLVAFRHRFDYAFELIDIPSVWVACGLVFAGLAVLALPHAIQQASARDGGHGRRLLVFVIATGVALRLAMFAVNPVLEDDYHRYFWDGAMTAHGLNPYAVAPADAGDVEGSQRARLAAEAGVVMERINHPNLKSIYPPVTQAAFALAYVIKPWSMTAWRLVCLIGEFATLALLLALLHAARRSPLWVAIYWWNPVAIKELINSAHMEAILTPLVLAALLLAVRRRPAAATLMLGVAAGAKGWPVLLLPLVARPLLSQPRTLVVTGALFGLMMLAWALPAYLGGIDETSGIVAYAQNWKTNSALFPALEWLAQAALAPLGIGGATPGVAVRGACAVLVLAISIWLSRAEPASPTALMQRAALVTAVLFLLSPAQFPWYFIWVLPFLCFAPSPALLAMTATVPIYYASFYFHARDTYEIYRDWLVWIVWVPVWLLIAREIMSRGNDMWEQVRNAR